MRVVIINSILQYSAIYSLRKGEKLNSRFNNNCWTFTSLLDMWDFTVSISVLYVLSCRFPSTVILFTLVKFHSRSRFGGCISIWNSKYFKMSDESAAFWLHSLRNFGNPRSDYFFRVMQTTLISKALHKTLHTSCSSFLCHLSQNQFGLLLGLYFFFLARKHKGNCNNACHVKT